MGGGFGWPPLATEEQLPCFAFPTPHEDPDAIRRCVRLTVQHGLVQAPVDAQAVLLLLHAPFTLAAVQGGGQQSCHGVLALVSRPGPQLYAAVPRHALPEGAQARAARVVAGAGIAGVEAVPAPRRERPTGDSCETEESDSGCVGGKSSVEALSGALPGRLDAQTAAGTARERAEAAQRKQPPASCTHGPSMQH